MDLISSGKATAPSSWPLSWMLRFNVGSLGGRITNPTSLLPRNRWGQLQHASVVSHGFGPKWHYFRPMKWNWILTKKSWWWYFVLFFFSGLILQKHQKILLNLLDPYFFCFPFPKFLGSCKSSYRNGLHGPSEPRYWIETCDLSAFSESSFCFRKVCWLTTCHLTPTNFHPTFSRN